VSYISYIVKHRINCLFNKMYLCEYLVVCSRSARFSVGEEHFMDPFISISLSRPCITLFIQLAWIPLLQHLAWVPLLPLMPLLHYHSPGCHASVIAHDLAWRTALEFLVQSGKCAFPHCCNTRLFVVISCSVKESL
jgi:hypothetical protein